MNCNPSEFHIPVLLNQVLEHLNIKENGKYLDGTLGMGGHAEGVLQRLGSKGKLFGMDRDLAALEMARIRLSKFKDQTKFFHGNFDNTKEALNFFGVETVDGIILDLGLSSFQMDNAERGFSLRKDGPLDMRMDMNSEISAYDLINTLSEKELESIIREYGEERFSKRIAKNIVDKRNQLDIKTTKEFSQVILQSMPFRKGYRNQKIHPATRTFQAFRIAVNQELESVSKFLESVLDCLSSKGRLLIISFHSLEDRIVKHTFREFFKKGLVDLLVKKPIFADDTQIQMNSRSRSAKLRVLEKI